MQKNITTNLLLLIIAAAMVAIAAHPLLVPRPAKADTTSGYYPVIIEPGVQMLRSPDGTTQVYGRVIVDLRNGKVWGFPTTTTAVYPINVSSPNPPVSHPFLLGTFALQDLDR